MHPNGSCFEEQGNTLGNSSQENPAESSANFFEGCVPSYSIKTMQPVVLYFIVLELPSRISSKAPCIGIRRLGIEVIDDQVGSSYLKHPRMLSPFG